MGINVYTGLMGSGKSYEVVLMVIVPAIAAGRRVVTNVDGINSDLVRAYVVEKQGVPVERLGHVVHVTNEDVFGSRFLPYYDDAKHAVTDTVVQPGDLVAIDEAWRFWGTDCKLLKEHKSFFLEHRHFTHSETNVACDLVLMIQDMGTLHRFVKNVVAFSFRCHKKIALGMPNTYSVTMWEGHKLVRKAECGNWVRRYDSAVFPLYSSFKGGAEGKIVNADGRQNMFASRKVVSLMVLVFCLFVAGGVRVWGYFHPKQAVQVVKSGTTGPNSDSGHVGAPEPTKPPVESFSEVWRIAGRFSVNGQGWIAVVDPAGRLRVVSPSAFSNVGLAMVGEVDGKRVTVWTGGVPSAVSSPAGPAVAGGGRR